MNFFFRKSIIFISVIALTGILSGGNALPQFDAYLVASKEDARDMGKDEKAVMTMKLINSQGEERYRKTIRFRRRVNNMDDTLVRFSAPADIRGTALLTLQRSDGDDVQFIYMPAMEKTRRISTQDKSVRFVGTDFNYEDMRRTRLDDFEYRPLREERFQDHDCYVYEAVPKKEGYSVYGKAVHWIQKDIYFRQKAEYYDKNLKLFKRATATKVEMVEGIWTGQGVIMEDLQEKHTTILTREWTKYNVGLQDDIFTVRELTNPEYGE